MILNKYFLEKNNKNLNINVYVYQKYHSMLTNIDNIAFYTYITSSIHLNVKYLKNKTKYTWKCQMF